MHIQLGKNWYPIECIGDVQGVRRSIVLAALGHGWLDFERGQTQLVLDDDTLIYLRDLLVFRKQKKDAMHDDSGACQCPRCGWLGTFHDSHELQTDPLQNICPLCATETVVQKLGQKGLDGLRQEYGLLTKISYARNLTQQEKMERREKIERFFAHIHQPIAGH